MNSRRLGANGPAVSTLGLGCSRMAQPGKDRSEQEAVATIQAALDAGMSYLDTADFYGMGYSESMIGQAIKDRRQEAFLSVKFGMLMSPGGAFLGLDGRPNSVKNFAAYSLQRLGVDEIDLYQPGRADPAVPWEETVGAIADLIREGKVRYLGVSEVGADHLKRAHQVHPVTALEIEYSLACRFIEAEILPAVQELGIGLVAYRVLADGLLTGAVTEQPKGDERMIAPRLLARNLQHNLEAVSVLNDLAKAKNVSSAQLAVAWVLSRGLEIVPLIGMSQPSRLPENLKSLDIQFTDAELQTLDSAFEPGAIAGERYPPMVLKYAAH